MQISVWIVTALIILVMFGAGQRILDRLRLSDKWALIILISIAIGLIIPPIKIGTSFSFSIGGFLIPFALCVYLLIKAGLSWDLFRAVVGTLITAAVILLLNILLPSKTAESIVVDNTFLYGVVAGLVAYILGRSRRNAFVCSVLGITLSSVAVFIYNAIVGVKTPLNLGVGGVFDSIILAVLISVGLTELMGKTVEVVVGKKEKVYNFEAGEFEELEEIYPSHEEKIITDVPISLKDCCHKGDSSDEK